MTRPPPQQDRDSENPDPEELHRPVPKLLIVVIGLLLLWALAYIVIDSPGLGSSSTPPETPATAPAG